jgi:hypothetical protein
MKTNIKKSTLHLLIALIVILSISTIYLSIEKFNQSKINKITREKVCTPQKKLCGYVEYKYTDALLMKIDLRAGEFYYPDERKIKYNNFWDNWQNDNKTKRIYNDSFFIIESFIPAINNETGKLYILFDDKDGFEIERIIIDLSKKIHDKENDRIQTSNIVNNKGVVVGREYSFKKKITLENYQTITDIVLATSSLKEFK